MTFNVNKVIIALDTESIKQMDNKLINKINESIADRIVLRKKFLFVLFIQEQAFIRGSIYLF